MCLFVAPFLAAGAIGFFSFLPKIPLKILAFGLSLVPLAILLYGGNALIGSEISYNWLPALSIDFHLSVDGVSWLFLLLVSLLLPMGLLATKSDIPFASLFYGLVLLLQGLLIGFFTARNLAIFTLFWEAIILPLYFIIALWGGGVGRSAAALKFLIYMAAGSSLMVAAVLALYFGGGATFDIDRLSAIASSVPHASWICAIFLLAFAVKTPLFPFHAWLGDAYCQAPTAGTILLAALLSKAGIYGVWRIGIGLFPTFLQAWSGILLPLAIIGAFYGAFAAWGQKDFKRLIAYASFSHVNFILAGLFVWNETAHTGALLQAFNHGITIGALFLVIGWLEERLQTTSIDSASGLAHLLPLLAWLTLFFVLASIALPGTNNFIGEFLVLFGIFVKAPWMASFLGVTIILSAVYMLRFMEKMYFGSPTTLKGFKDIGYKEIALAIPLIAIIALVGIFPTPLLEKLQLQEKSPLSLESQKDLP